MLTPREALASTLPITVTITGSELEQASEIALVSAEAGVAATIDIIDRNSNTIILLISLTPEQITREMTFALTLNGREQPGLLLVLRDYLRSVEVRGIRLEYAESTTRIAEGGSPANILGPYTRLRTEMDVNSTPGAILYPDDTVDILDEHDSSWYQVRVLRSKDPGQQSQVGWIERWLVDGSPPPKAELQNNLEQARFSGSLGKTPRDEAVACGTAFDSSIYGSVERADGRGIGGARLWIISADGVNRYPTTTLANGTYSVSGLGCTIWTVELLSVQGIAVEANKVTVRTLNGGKFTAAEVRFRQIR